MVEKLSPKTHELISKGGNSMNYEVQQALGRKVDDWRFHALESKVSGLEHDNRELSRQVSTLEGNIRNHYQAIERLLQILSEKELFADESNSLIELRQYL